MANLIILIGFRITKIINLWAYQLRIILICLAEVGSSILNVGDWGPRLQKIRKRTEHRPSQ